jgi:hypothetical protein
MNEIIHVPDGPEQQGLVEEIKSLTTITQKEMGMVSVTDQASLTVAVQFGREVKSRAAKIEERLDKILKPLNESRNSLLELKRTSLAPFTAWEKQIKLTCTTFMEEQERKAAEERRQAEEAARKLAEDARLAHAAAVEATQGREAATTLLEQPVTPVPIPKAPEPPKAAGASFTTRWKHEVTDAALVPREFLTVDERALAAYATARKDKAVVPGVRFYAEKSMGLRS